MIPDCIENAQWLELLRPFAAAKNLYLSDQFAPHIVSALKELVIGGRTIEVFPVIQNIIFFSWRGSNHRNSSRKAFGSLLPRDRPRVTQ